MLEKVVEDLMKEQHKEMLRRLKSGEFDSRITSNTEASSPQVSSPASPTVSQTEPPAPSPSEQEKNTNPEKTLDEIIFEYLASTKD